MFSYSFKQLKGDHNILTTVDSHKATQAEAVQDIFEYINQDLKIKTPFEAIQQGIVSHSLNKFNKN